MSALAGRTVMVTRARAQAGALCGALEDRGARAMVFPAITIEPIPGALAHVIPRLSAYDWIAFTSANAVEVFWSALTERGLGLPVGLRLAAVGPATATALARRGLAAAIIPAAGTGVGLAQALGAARGCRILFPRSAIARAETAAALRARGAAVDDIAVYQTVACRPSLRTMRRLSMPVDAVTFTSPSTVSGFLEAGGRAARRVMDQAAVACLGPLTAAAVRRLGAEVAVQPRSHNTAGLVDALEVYFAPRGRR